MTLSVVMEKISVVMSVITIILYSEFITYLISLQLKKQFSYEFHYLHGLSLYLTIYEIRLLDSMKFHMYILVILYA